MQGRGSTTFLERIRIASVNPRHRDHGMRSRLYIAGGSAALVACLTLAIHIANAKGDPAVTVQIDAPEGYETCFMKRTLVFASSTPRLEMVRRCRRD